MKKMFFLILMLFFYPSIVNADVGYLEHSYQKLARVGEEITYKFSMGLESYEYFIEYDENLLEFQRAKITSFHCAATAPLATVTEETNSQGKLKVSKLYDKCYPDIEIIFKAKKTGNAKLNIIGGKETGFAIHGAPQEINIKTEIVSSDNCTICEKCPEVQECEKCTECEKCPEVQECEKCVECEKCPVEKVCEENNTALVVGLIISIIGNIGFVTALIIVMNKLKKQNLIKK